VNDGAAVEAAIDAIVKERRPAVLVNNAGITRDTLAMRMKDDDWDAVHRHQPQGRVPTSRP
jgi:3-oxoacyl-[acyl-carrier protein] reductase